MQGFVKLVECAGITSIINRPLNMGYAIKNGDTSRLEITKAFAFLKNTVPSGIVLTGTGKVEHLKINVSCFAAA